MSRVPRKAPAVPRSSELPTDAVVGRLPGAAALQVDADGETGEVASLKVLGEFGEIPDDFKDSLQGG